MDSDERTHAKHLVSQFGANAKYVVSEIQEALKKLKADENFDDVYYYYTKVKAHVELLLMK